MGCSHDDRLRHRGLAHLAVASMIPGSRSPEAMRQIVAWLKTPVPAALWSDLKDGDLLDSAAPVPT
jgi:D-threo-aldose 1-dehydrogenase